MATKITYQKRKEYTKRYDEKHPFKNKWYKMRYRAKKRKISFELEYEEFRDWCLEQQLQGKTGRTANDLSVDRIRSWEGYNINNLQVLTVSENSQKHILPPKEDLPDWYNNRPKVPCPF